MSIATKRAFRKAGSDVVLHNGDQMKQPQFHLTYEAMPEDYRAELIGGIVFEPSPLGYAHGKNDSRLITLLDHYAGLTPGLETASNATVIMGEEDEVQPDVSLRIAPAYGGQTRNTKPKTKTKTSYIEGAPELVAEVAHTSRAIDLHLKKDRYMLAGVIEYVVLCLDPLQVHWFDLQHKRNLQAGSDGIFKSKVFPGLWIDENALLQLDYVRSMAALSRGMQSAEYRAFASKLAKKNKA